MKDVGGGGNNLFAAQSAFLGPNIWDKTMPYTEDFNLEYMDLDEFLMENCINDDKAANPAPQNQLPQQPPQPQQQKPISSPEPLNINMSPLHHSPLPQLSPVLGPQPPSPQALSPAGPSNVAAAPVMSPCTSTSQSPAPVQQVKSQLEKYLTGAGSPPQLPPSPPQTPANNPTAATAKPSE